MPTSRRTFLEEVSFASLIAGFPLSAQAALLKAAENPPQPLFPKALRKGDTVALISPASPGNEPDVNAVAVEIVKSLGYEPKLMPNAGKSTMYLAGSDTERAADLNAAFADPSVDAVWCLRGGYGTSRILPLIDYESIRKNPKIFIGYSDITGTLNAIHKMTGLVTFHGPNGADNQSDYTLDQFRRVVANPQAAGRIAEPPPPLRPPREGWVDRENRLYRITSGKARGRLVGGNISVFSTLIGTPFEPELKGRILFLEEVGEDPYRIDRWLTQFLLTGKLSGLAGVALGRFSKCTPGDYKPSFAGYGTWSWEEVCKDRLGRLGIPVVANLVFGHVSDKATLPLGVMAELDGDAGTLTLLEAAVR
ncbi:MAG: LD-carboxypeptidase [Thermoanaerobaculia bacterium]|jgi:muramoyltetrapeptide carboxypeptidase